ncbi:MAG TPA: ABC transporter ATP-binding protein [Actinomycetota bacterium]|jgi:ABC-2 type transport system ATP-binding protein/ribosome-dependent ATPase|nr:ABC transporter ATP-binding protein [Actinomycetota bacterium]
MTPLAQGVGVGRRFGHLVAVDGVHLRVDPGEVVGLLGANGAGKTTLIRVLLGLLPATEGYVRLFGDPPSRSSRRRIGYVPQGLGLYDDLSAEENLWFAQAVFGGERGTLPPALRRLGSVPIGRLPLGVQRRVAFAQALAHRPDLLVLDEPTSGVDPLARARLWETIRDAADAGVGILVTTHYMDEAEECDRLVVLAEGRVVAEGTVSEIVGGSSVVLVETEPWQRAFGAIEGAGLSAALVGRTLRVLRSDRSEVERALAGAPARIEETAATLEERFLELTLARGTGRDAA